MEQLPYYTIVPGEVAHSNVDVWSQLGTMILI